MTKKNLIIFDFDGVIIDGMEEYWSSSRKACSTLFPSNKSLILKKESVPNSFKNLRPWVEFGWEMVLLTNEISQEKSLLSQKGWKYFSSNYQEECLKAIKKLKTDTYTLQLELDRAREKAIKNDFEKWLYSHKSFPGVINRIKKIHKEGYLIAVLSTKNSVFTSKILSSFQVDIDFIFGHEAGKKTDVLCQLIEKYEIFGFIEDKLSTLKKVKKNKIISSIPCFLADWGYLKPNDIKDCQQNISLLNTKTFMSPLANWH